MKFVVSIGLSSAGELEVPEILQHLARTLLRDGLPSEDEPITLRDINGNPVGHAYVDQAPGV